jgi:putative transposase
MNHWPHSPPHNLSEQGAYMVTCGTYRKDHLLNSPERLDMFEKLLFDAAAEHQWDLHAWAIMSNHYHFIASSPSDPSNLGKMTSKVHTLSARELNRLDRQQGRKVWFQYFDTHITFANSYLPRLKYVHQNPTHHGVVANAENYAWCSAAWFARTAKPSFRATVETFKTDRLNVIDDYGVWGTVERQKSGVKPPHSKEVSTTSDTAGGRT